VTKRNRGAVGMFGGHAPVRLLIGGGEHRGGKLSGTWKFAAGSRRARGPGALIWIGDGLHAHGYTRGPALGKPVTLDRHA
jgi:hypothetical protein